MRCGDESMLTCHGRCCGVSVSLSSSGGGLSKEEKKRLKLEQKKKEKIQRMMMMTMCSVFANLTARLFRFGRVCLGILHRKLRAWQNTCLCWLSNVHAVVTVKWLCNVVVVLHINYSYLGHIAWDTGHCCRQMSNGRPASYAVRKTVAYLVCLCLFFTFMGHAKIAQLIEVAFGELTHVGPRNHVLDGRPDPQRGGGNLCGLLDPLKIIGSLLQFAANWIIQSSITAQYVMQPFIDILWPLVSLHSYYWDLVSKLWDMLQRVDTSHHVSLAVVIILANSSLSN